METNDKNTGGIAHDDSTKKPQNSDFKDFVANDGMTAKSARMTKEDSEQIDAAYDVNDKPGSKYNINDQAHSQSSKEDFVKTVSNFEHSDGTQPPSAIDSKNLSPD